MNLKASVGEERQELTEARLGIGGRLRDACQDVIFDV